MTREVCAAALLLCVAAHAQNYTFTTLSDRGSGNPTAINDAGQITGNSASGGFVYSSGTFTYTSAYRAFYADGINNEGVISGTLETSGNDVGAIFNDGSMTTFSVPGSVATRGYKVNDRGVVVGGYYTTNSPNFSSIYTWDGNSFTTLNLPDGATFAFPAGLDNAGQIVGEYGTTANTLVQFLYDGTTFHTINCPNGTPYSGVTGISNSGILFEWCNNYLPSGSFSGTFYFFYKDGVYSIVNTPGPITGMNRAGEIVGIVGYAPGGAGPSTPGFIGTPTALRFVPLTPCRVVDTRLADGPFGGPELVGGKERDFTIQNGVCGIPSDAAAYSLNVTAVPDSGLGFLSIWPAGQAQPLVSTLNSDGR